MGSPALGAVTGESGSALVAPIRPGSIGMLGGTFDPFHLGHLALARAARDQLGLERVLVIPAANPPHKTGRPISPPEVRLALVEAGIAGEPRLEASRIELDRGGPSWTVDTVEALVAAQRSAGRAPDVTVILSAESFAGLATWHRPERLLELSRVAVAPRPGYPAPDVTAADAVVVGGSSRIALLDLPAIAVSASEIRRLVALGEPIDGLVSPAVAEVIRDNGLYRHPEQQETASP